MRCLFFCFLGQQRRIGALEVLSFDAVQVQLSISNTVSKFTFGVSYSA